MLVSVVIPILNEERYIEKCINSLLKQDYNKENLEVLLVDGMSKDRTREMASNFSQKYKFIHLLDNPQKITPIAMNIGIKAAKGQIIVRMDAHAEYADDYITKCVEWSKKSGADNVGGPMIAVGNGYIGKAIEFVHHSIFGLGGGKFHDENYSGFVDTVYLGAFNREIFNKVGFYDERLVRNQDIELNSRIRAAGGKCYLTPEIKSLYYNRSTLKGLWQQNFKNGLWNIYTSTITKNALSVRHFIPLIFVVSLIITSLLFLVSYFMYNDGAVLLIAQILFFLCFGSYLFVALFFSLKSALKHGLKYLFILPIIFFTLHFSYGLGSINGVVTVKEWIRKNKEIELTKVSIG